MIWFLYAIGGFLLFAFAAYVVIWLDDITCTVGRIEEKLDKRENV